MALGQKCKCVPLSITEGGKVLFISFFNLNNAISRLIDSRQLSESTLICSSKKTILDAVAMIGGNHLYKFSIVDHYLPRSSSYLQEP